jgi:hypothetical protein
MDEQDDSFGEQTRRADPRHRIPFAFPDATDLCSAHSRSIPEVRTKSGRRVVGPSFGCRMRWWLRSLVIGFPPREANVVLYGVTGEDNETLLAQLGKQKRGVGCLYIAKLDDIDRVVLSMLITQAAADPRWARTTTVAP